MSCCVILRRSIECVIENNMDGIFLPYKWSAKNDQAKGMNK